MLQWKTGVYHSILNKRKREAGIFQPLFLSTFKLDLIRLKTYLEYKGIVRPQGLQQG